MRKESIKELLDEVKETFEIVVIQIFQKPKVKEKLYFPYASNESEFEKSIKRNLPDLELHFPKIYLEVKSIQSFVCNSNWLTTMCTLTNDAKHNNAIDIHRDDEIVKAASISAGGVNLAYLGGNFSNIRFINTRVNGVLIDDFVYDQREVVITKKGDIAINYKITKDRKIIVGNDQIDLLPFLDGCIANTENFITRLYKLL